MKILKNFKISLSQAYCKNPKISYTYKFSHQFLAMKDIAIEEIWTEKYRPKFLKDVIGQDNVTKRLMKFVETKSMPHCLFVGPAGIGKTTCALAIAREFFGENWHNNFLELNASDERGIDTIRIKVKDFARTLPISGRFKIVYLDEADSLTKDAQHALRRTMEDFSSLCRFILACNYSSKIIPPIQSRCAVFKFSTLKEDDISNFLKNIAKNENLKIDDDAISAIIYISEGDMRKAVNLLQMSSLDGAVTKEAIYSLASRDPEEVRKMLLLAMNKRFKEARDILLTLLYQRGLAGEDITKEIHDQILQLDLSDEEKMLIIEKIGECDFRISEGANPRIQLEALLAWIAFDKKRFFRNL